MVVNLPSAIIKTNVNIDISKTQCVAFGLFKIHFLPSMHNKETIHFLQEEHNFYFLAYRQ